MTPPVLKGWNGTAYVAIGGSTATTVTAVVGAGQAFTTIQAALDVVGALGKGHFLVREGTYPITQQLRVWSRTMLEFEPGAVLTQPNGTILYRLIGNKNYAVGDTNIVLLGVTVDGNGANQTTTSIGINPRHRHRSAPGERPRHRLPQRGRLPQQRHRHSHHRLPFQQQRPRRHRLRRLHQDPLHPGHHQQQRRRPLTEGFVNPVGSGSQWATRSPSRAALAPERW